MTKKNMTKTIKKQLLDAKINGASKLEIQRLQQLLDKEIEKQFDELIVKLEGEDTYSQYKITEVVSQLQELLITKNKAYGNSALEPINIFSKNNAVDSLCARIDDKLSRIKNKGLSDETEDTLFDLAGYLILLIIARDDK
jgi:hypothetical protein|tara:strand:+ start:45 stop:464 length:420 start_codon:yes stop_codon:yes gene_type:complete